MPSYGMFFLMKIPFKKAMLWRPVQTDQRFPWVRFLFDNLMRQIFWEMILWHWEIDLLRDSLMSFIFYFLKTLMSFIYLLLRHHISRWRKMSLNCTRVPCGQLFACHVTNLLSENLLTSCQPVRPACYFSWTQAKSIDIKSSRTI